MQHHIIIRAAVGLTAVLLVVALAFAWATTFREARLAAQEAAAGPAEPAYDAQAAAGRYEERCSMCHERSELDAWVMALPADGVEQGVFEFLAGHGKAPQRENRLIARYLAATAASQKNQ
jgi:hypothetical protein